MLLRLDSPQVIGCIDHRHGTVFEIEILARQMIGSGCAIRLASCRCIGSFDNGLWCRHGRRSRYRCRDRAFCNVGGDAKPQHKTAVSSRIARSHAKPGPAWSRNPAAPDRIAVSAVGTVASPQRAPINGCTGQVVAPAIRCPFPGIADHVEQAVGIRFVPRDG